MRILLVSNMFPSKKDRLFGIFVKNFKTEFEKQGIEFPGNVLIKGKSYSSAFKLLRYSLHYLKIIYRFYTVRYDVLYVHYLMHHIPVLMFLRAFKKTPWAVNLHGSDLKGILEHRQLKSRANTLFRKIDLLVVPTVEFQRMILKQFPMMEAEKIAISPSGGIDESLFYPTNFNEKNNQLTLGFVSRINEEKGWKTFLHALYLLKENQVPFKAIIGGKGPDEELMKTEIVAKELNQHVDFRGFIPQEDLHKVYNQMSVYIFPTYRDSLGLTGLEAMSCGIPVIASRIEGGPSSYVVDGNNGYLFNPRDGQDLYQKIKMFNRLNPQEKTSMTEKALDTASIYKRSHVTAELIKELKKLDQ